jgi:uncharacterized protein
MMAALARGRAFAGLVGVLLIAPSCQAAADSLETLRSRANSGTVGVVSGGVDGTYIRIAADLAAVLDDGDGLRVLALIGKGSVQNLSDIIFLKGIDIGIVQSDVLTYAKRERLYPGVDKSVEYITKLYDEELHLLARNEISRIEDLAGKKVNVDLRGSGTAITASLVFAEIGVPIEPTNFDQALALEKLKRGEIAALAYVTGRPARLFRDLQAGDGLHFLPIQANAALLETYLPGQLTHEDYPQLLPSEAAVDTLAVGAVMAVYAWAPETERYRKVARFVDVFFNRFDAFLKPPRHAKWKEVNLAAQVPGWRQFQPAEAWLKRQVVAYSGSSGPSGAQFEAFFSRAGVRDRQAPTEAQKTAIFKDFLRWSNQRRSGPPQNQ